MQTKVINDMNQVLKEPYRTSTSTQCIATTKQFTSYHKYEETLHYDKQLSKTPSIFSYKLAIKIADILKFLQFNSNIKRKSTLGQ